MITSQKIKHISAMGPLLTVRYIADSR